MATECELTLNRSDVTSEERQGRKVYRLTAQTADPVNVDPAIFIYQREVISPNGEPVDSFYGVCGAIELTDYPPEATGPNSNGFYRTNTVDLLFYDLNLLEETWQILQSDLQLLLWELYELSDLQTGESKTFRGSTRSDQ